VASEATLLDARAPPPHVVVWAHEGPTRSRPVPKPTGRVNLLATDTPVTGKRAAPCGARTPRRRPRPRNQQRLGTAPSLWLGTRPTPPDARRCPLLQTVARVASGAPACPPPLRSRVPRAGASTLLTALPAVNVDGVETGRRQRPAAAHARARPPESGRRPAAAGGQQPSRAGAGRSPAWCTPQPEPKTSENEASQSADPVAGQPAKTCSSSSTKAPQHKHAGLIAPCMRCRSWRSPVAKQPACTRATHFTTAGATG